jgi:hypothetical protein
MISSGRWLLSRPAGPSVWRMRRAEPHEGQVSPAVSASPCADAMRAGAARSVAPRIVSWTILAEGLARTDARARASGRLSDPVAPIVMTPIRHSFGQRLSCHRGVGQPVNFWSANEPVLGGLRPRWGGTRRPFCESSAIPGPRGADVSFLIEGGRSILRRRSRASVLTLRRQSARVAAASSDLACRIGAHRACVSRDEERAYETAGSIGWSACRPAHPCN